MMKTYSGFKVIQAKPEFKIDENGKQEEGYIVVYADGYNSWSPKDVFEKAYVDTDTDLSCSHALALAKEGNNVYRTTWTNNTYMCYINDKYVFNNFYRGENYPYKNSLDLSDINATDWKIKK